MNYHRKMKDKELLTQTLESFVLKTTESLFGISSVPAQAFIRYGVKNVIEKYGGFLDFFTDKNGSLNIPLLLEGIKGELRARGGFEVWNIRFTEKDVDELLKIYNELKNEN